MDWIAVVATVGGWAFGFYELVRAERIKERQPKIDEVNAQLERLANLQSYYRQLGRWTSEVARGQDDRVITDQHGKATINARFAPEPRFEEALRSKDRPALKVEADLLALQIRLAMDEVTDTLHYYDPSGSLTSQFGQLWWKTEQIETCLKNPDFQDLQDALKEVTTMRLAFESAWRDTYRHTSCRRTRHLLKPRKATRATRPGKSQDPKAHEASLRTTQADAHE